MDHNISVDVLTNEQIEAGYMAVDDEDFVYLMRRQKPDLVAVFTGHVTPGVIQDTVKIDMRKGSV